MALEQDHLHESGGEDALSRRTASLSVANLATAIGHSPNVSYAWAWWNLRVAGIAGQFVITLFIALFFVRHHVGASGIQVLLLLQGINAVTRRHAKRADAVSQSAIPFGVVLAIWLFVNQSLVHLLLFTIPPALIWLPLYWRRFGISRDVCELACQAEAGAATDACRILALKPGGGYPRALFDFLNVAERMAGKPEYVAIREFSPLDSVNDRTSDTASDLLDHLERGSVFVALYDEIRKISYDWAGAETIDVSLLYANPERELRFTAESTEWMFTGDPVLVELVTRELVRNSHGVLRRAGI